nr:flagellar protein FliS [uncultured Niameybacter sp.]
MVTTAYIAEATDVQLVCVTYELFLDCIKEAIKCQEEARKKKVDEAREVLLILCENLNFEVELAHNLFQLYVYVQDLLINHYKEDSKLEEAYKLIEIIYNGYNQIAKENTNKQQTIQNAQTIYAGMTYGKGYLNEITVESPNRGYRV